MYLPKKLISEMIIVKDELFAAANNRNEHSDFDDFIAKNEQYLFQENKEASQAYYERFNVETKYIYQTGAFFTNVMNNILLENRLFFSNNSKKFKNLSAVERIFKGKKFKLVFNQWDNRIEIILDNKTMISSILNNFWGIDKEVSTAPMKVYNEIKDSKMFGKSLEISYVGFDIKYNEEEGFDRENLFNVFNTLMTTNMIEESLSSMNMYLKAQNKKDKWNTVQAFAKVMESNNIFHKAFINILTKKEASPSLELMAAFILSSRSKHLPLFKLVKKEKSLMFNEKINLSLRELDSFFSVSEMSKINDAIAVSISTTIGSLITKELQSDRNLLDIFNRAKNYYESENVSNIIENKEEEFSKILLNNKNKFFEIYSIEQNKLLEICKETEEKKKITFKEDLDSNLSQILVISNNKNLNKAYKKQVGFYVDLTRQFAATGFNKSDFNIEIFDKIAELFFKNFLLENYPNVKIVSEFTNIRDEMFMRHIKDNLFIENHIKMSVGYDKIFLNENRNQIKFDISKLKVEEQEVFEAAVGNLTTIFSHVILKSIRASKQEIDVVGLIKYTLSNEQNAKQQNERIVKNTALLMINNVFNHREIKENLQNFIREKNILLSMRQVTKDVNNEVTVRRKKL